MPRPHSSAFLWTMVALTVTAIAGVWVYVTKSELGRIAQERSVEGALIEKAKIQLREIKAAPKAQKKDLTALKAQMRAILEVQAAERTQIEALKEKIESYAQTTNP